MTAASLTALTLCTSVAAFINPNFTPVHLVAQSETIALVEFQTVGDDGQVAATVVEVLKGEMPSASLKIDLLAGAFEAKGRVIMTLASGPHKRALMFVGAFERSDEEEMDDEEGPKALLHVGKEWVTLSWWEETETWDMDDIDAVLLGTWAGADVMLRRAVRYLLTDEQADVPIISNASWAEKVAAGSVTGKVCGVHPVDLAGDGKIVLHIAAAEGDRLLQYDPAAKELVDITSRHKLTAHSRVAAWADFNRDGRVDLASYRGRADLTGDNASQVWLYLQQPDGTFPDPPALLTPMTVKTGCQTLAAVDCGPKGVGLVIGREGGALLATVSADGKRGGGQLYHGTLPPEMNALIRKTGQCLVADFDNDSIVDVLALAADGSLLYRGKAPGQFAAPVVAAPGHGSGRAAAFVGDYDMDGLIDVLTVGETGNRIFHNLGDGKFEEMLAMSGEIEYIAKRGGIGGMTGDVNNDGRQDVLILYSAMSPQLFFNRGFHSFGHARGLDIDNNKLLDAAGDGQQAGCLADVDGD